MRTGITDTRKRQHNHEQSQKFIDSSTKQKEVLVSKAQHKIWAGNECNFCYYKVWNEQKKCWNSSQMSWRYDILRWITKKEMLLNTGCEKYFKFISFFFFFQFSVSMHTMIAFRQFIDCYPLCTVLSIQKQSDTKVFFRENSFFLFNSLFHSSDDMKSYNKYSAICRQLSLHWITLAPCFSVSF